MNVLSLFDGMSCGQIALAELGIPVEKYYASEVDKFAIKATMQNFPNTIQLGDVRKLDISLLDKIDLIIGGSPCTNLSMSGKRKGLATKEGMEVLDLKTYLELKKDDFEFEGQSYLFWEYIRIYHELIERGDNTKFFLENVEMGKKWESVFNEAIGREGIHINSALVSAQNRRRIYWTDIHNDIPQPEDRGILLWDILEEDVDEKYFLSDKMIECSSLGVACEGVNHPALHQEEQIQEKFEKGEVTVQKDNLVIVSGTVRTFGGKHFREIKSGKSCTLLALARNDGNSQPCIRIGTQIRRLTPTECARLQTVPEWYKWDGISDTKRYKMLGNGWTIEIIKHIFKYLEK